MRKELLYVVIPAYNEEDNIVELVRNWYQMFEKLLVDTDEDFQMIIVDDGSKDKTPEILKMLKDKYPKLRSLAKKNGGHGSAVLYGYRYAIANGAKWIFQTDSDGQTNPEEFIKFWENRQEYDVVLGNRVIRGDGKSRKFVENTVCFF